MSLIFRILSAALVVTLLAGCAGGSAMVSAKKALHSELPRVSQPQVPEQDARGLSAGNRAFALDLFRALPEDGNLFFSPYSISLALAMTYAGARGGTADGMADALHFDLPPDRLHPAFNALDLALASRKQQGGQGADGKGFRLNIVNDLWGQADFSFQPEFLDLLSANYGAGMRLVDFTQDSEDARQAINDYVAEQTEGRIKDLIPAGAVDPMTRLVLTNAIYFNAAWQHPFAEEMTEPAPFTRLDGSQVEVQMMRQPAYEQVPYVAGDGFQAAALPYENPDLAMWLVLPDAGRFEEIQSALDVELLDTLLNSQGGASVLVSMPRFTVEDDFLLKGPLSQLGMGEAFDPARADLSGITSAETLYISEVVHKSFVKVDEAGTEAAAATAVIARATSMAVDTVDLKVDRPFLFLIVDQPTQTVLFLGRVVEVEE